MEKRIHTHWILREIAEERAPRSTINLWPRLESHKDLGLVGSTQNRTARILTGRYAPALLLVLVLIGSLIFVPAVRAFAEDIIQRMGIAFVNTDQFSQDTQVVKIEATEILNPPPSLSVEEIRDRIGFHLLLPTWLPTDLSYVHRSISRYDPTTWEGSGKKLTIEYSPTANFDPASGLLFLHANDGPIGAAPLLAEGREQTVTINGQTGYYVHGGWQDDGRGDPNTRLGNLFWDDQADDAYLTWMQDGVTYLLEAHNLSLGLDDLLRIAESMAAP